MRAALEAVLQTRCGQPLGGTHPISGLRRLSGGANMETWAFDYGPVPLILRRLPAAMDSAQVNQVSALSIEDEARVIRTAGAHGVTVPSVITTLEPADGIGRGFIMSRVQGETLAKRIQKKPEFEAARRRFTADCARELAHIHQIPVNNELPSLPLLTPQRAIEMLSDEFAHYHYESPISYLAFHWLRHCCPDAPAEPSVLHGDFRLGNLLIDAEGMTGVLDWELAHLGDPAQDLAYICTPSWRFANYAQPVGGLGEMDEFLRQYALQGGQPVPAERVQFWLVYSSLWWLAVCLKMAGFWRSGEDRSLERAIIGRRVTEAELDLLLLMESANGDYPAKVVWQPPAAADTVGTTSYGDVSQAVVEWLNGIDLDALEPRLRFENRVAANGLGMVTRALTLGPVVAARAADRLAALKHDEDSFTVAAKNGAVSLDDPATLTHLRLSALDQLYLDQPEYPGLGFALKRWT